MKFPRKTTSDQKSKDFFSARIEREDLNSIQLFRNTVLRPSLRIHGRIEMLLMYHPFTILLRPPIVIGPTFNRNDENDSTPIQRIINYCGWMFAFHVYMFVRNECLRKLFYYSFDRIIVYSSKKHSKKGKRKQFVTNAVCMFKQKKWIVRIENYFFVSCPLMFQQCPYSTCSYAVIPCKAAFLINFYIVRTRAHIWMVCGVRPMQTN